MGLSAWLHAKETSFCQCTRLAYLRDKLDEYDAQRRHNKADRHPGYHILQSLVEAHDGCKSTLSMSAVQGRASVQR